MAFDRGAPCLGKLTMTETNAAVEQTRCCDINFACMPWLVSRLFLATANWYGIQEQCDTCTTKIFRLIA